MSGKSPVTRKAGKGFADPSYDLSVDWLRARADINKAQKRHDQANRSRILLICGASRNDKTCPGGPALAIPITAWAK